MNLPIESPMKDSMLVSHIELADRVARRYRQSQARTQEVPNDQDIFWKLPAREVKIPDELVIQCSNGCNLTTADVEASISQTRDVVKGSCRFHQVHARAQTNGARFEVLVDGSKRVRGLVTVCVVADATTLTAYSIIELDVDPG